MKFIFALLVLSISVTAQARTISCRSSSSESGLASFSFDTIQETGVGFYNDLDAGQRVTLIRAPGALSMNPLKLKVREKNITVLVDVVRKQAVAFEQNDSNVSEPFQTRFQCR